MNKSILVAGIAIPALVWAQAPSSFVQPPQPMGGGSQPTSPSRTEDTHTTGPTKKSDSPYSGEIPAFDASTESVTFMSKTYSLSDTRFFGQFEGYLVQTPAAIEAAGRYRAILRDILDTLDRSSKGTTDSKVSTTARLLTEAAAYPGDSGVSESLKNSIVMARLAMRKSSLNDQEIAKLNEDYARLIRNMTVRESKTNLNVSQSSQPGQGGDQAQTRVENRTSVRGLEDARQQAEFLALEKKLELEGEVSVKLAKWQYQAMLMQLFMQRRFEHCVIGCRLYNNIFDDGESQLKMENGSDMQKFFKDSLGVQPTVAGLDAAANESIGKAKKLADAVSNHLERKQTDAATRRMIEAFVIGEHLTPIHEFSPNYRNMMHQYILDSKQLMDAAEVKNWQEAESFTSKLRDQAVDFRYIKAITAINGYKNGSNFELSQAKISMARNENDKAKVHMDNAIRMWPTNPAINAATIKIETDIEKLFQDKEALEVKATEFEGLVRNEEFRKLSLKDAGTFQELFRRAMDNAQLQESQRDHYRKLFDKASELYTGLEAIETAIRTARGYADNSQYYQAWEIIKLELDKDHLEKSRLRDEFNEYSSRANRFSELFVEAEEHINNKNYGSALSCLLKAQSLHAKSKLAQDGIDSLIAKRNE
jgi:hypothetical protein